MLGRTRQFILDGHPEHIEAITLASTSGVSQNKRQCHSPVQGITGSIDKVLDEEYKPVVLICCAAQSGE